MIFVLIRPPVLCESINGSCKPYCVSIFQQLILVSDVVEKTSTCRRSRIPACVVVEKITTRRREGIGVIVEKNEESRRTFNNNSCDLLTAITHTEILVARRIFLIKSESVTD